MPTTITLRPAASMLGKEPTTLLFQRHLAIFLPEKTDLSRNTAVLL